MKKSKFSPSEIARILKEFDQGKKVEEIAQERPRDISKAGRILRFSKSSLRYLSVKNDTTLENKLIELAKVYPRNVGLEPSGLLIEIKLIQPGIPRTHISNGSKRPTETIS